MEFGSAKVPVPVIDPLIGCLLMQLNYDLLFAGLIAMICSASLKACPRNYYMTALAVLNKKMVALCQRYAVMRLRVFGSALSSEWNEATSDFDFLVEYGQ